MPSYALIDAAIRSDTPQAVRYFTQGHAARSLFVNQPEHALADAGPWLAELDGNTALQQWLQVMDSTSAGAIAHLTSAADFDTVFRHLETCLDLTLADGSQALFRFWDGRVFKRLLHVLTQAQWRALFGPVDVWQVTLRGRALTLRRDALQDGAG